MSKYFKLGSKTLLLLLGVLVALSAWSVPKRNIPTTITQPDGTKFECFVSGDEFHNWLHDANGYTIMQHPKTGYYVYAVEKNGALVATDFVVGKVKPSSTKALEPNANISNEMYLQKRARRRVNNNYSSLDATKGRQGVAPLQTYADVTLNNVVIFIRFADVTPASETISYYENVYNTSTQSLKDYYDKVTYNKLAIQSSFYPAPSGGYVVWYTDTQNRNYYRPYNATTNPIGFNPNAEYPSTESSAYREHLLLKNAIDAVKSQIPTSLNLDSNGDSYVDLISFIVQGANDEWNDLLWPHQWALSTQDAFVNGKKVGNYTFQIQFFESSRIDLGTLCHEMFHQLGAPDLYHYDKNATVDAVGTWDVMSGTLNVPQNMGAYMKYTYGGWINSIPEITATGTYTLNPLATSATQNCFRIPSPNSHSEYFVVEYRKRESYDAGLAGDGLLVYRINSYLEGVGNADGPPDEVYIYRPDGTLSDNGLLRNAAYSSTAGRTAINDQTNPKSFLSDGLAGGLNISNVTAAGSSISFNVNVDFIPNVVLKNDKGLASGIGNESYTFTVATKFTVADLTALVGRKITKVDFYLNGNKDVDVTTNEVVKVWEVNPSTFPSATLAPTYSQDVSAVAKFDAWTSHTLSQPLDIKANKEYWVGYTVKASGGFPIATDAGPMVVGKGAWVLWDGSWMQLTELGASLNYNFLIRAIVGSSTTGVESVVGEELGVNLYPNPVVSNSELRLTLPQSGTVSVDIFNMLGQKVSSIPAAVYESGKQVIPFTPGTLAEGVYLYTVRFESGNKQTTTTRRFVVAR